ncbi:MULTISPECIES: ROK family transcriptional regulator [Rhizobium/Agrobacterium group]|uniref:Transcriptional regulator ROK family n=2 Tax=Rhizobium/Agrobacterium group TaxID=227290 RepID=B9K552_ALLAM|nr:MULTISPECIES: ROK family transcriptional regulator [Rhizobium/Agrobacterium group]ACM40000.1 transcriptional regulator ROK family [Allorhizobium ampelinum S4]MCF1448119.1 ROK family transcriptional regulator [Allorhizobium ampelinum]MUO41407.1 ROK family protein [Agrobacterium vitis]MUP09011.1 ROK family protein [Agrobacterium vitis]
MSYSGANGEQAAALNRAIILNAIHRGGPISRTEIAKLSRLTKQAVTRIVDKLLDEGLVMEARRRQGLRGQPAIELEIDPEGAFAIGANIDRDHLTIVAVDAVGNVRGRIHHEARFLLPDAFVKLMEDAVSSFLRRKVIHESRLAGIGLAIPDWLGEVQVIGLPDTYSQWNGFDVRAALSHITDHPIYIDNDANAAALGEIEYGLGTEMRSFFYILISACLGGSLVIDGMRHKGAGGLGGEIGWLPTAVTTGPLAGETRPLGDMLSMFVLLDYLADNGVDVATPADLLTLDARGRALLSGWLKKMAVNLAEAVSDIGMVVDPDGIILGGRLPVRLIDELLLYVHEEISRRGALAPSLHRAAASEDAAALGAAAMALADRLCLPSADSAHLSRSPLTTAIRPASINSVLAAAVR